MSSIEEDIKILESMLEEYENCSVPEIDMQVDVTFGKKQANAIKTLLGNLEALCDMQRSADRELKRQKQINEEHQKLNGELREKVKKIEEKNKHLSNVNDYETISLECTNLEEQLEIANSKIQELEEENAMLRKSNNIAENVNIDDVTQVINNSYEEFMSNYIPKQKVKQGLEDIEDYFDRLNGPDEDIEYIRHVKQEILEEEK